MGVNMQDLDSNTSKEVSLFYHSRTARIYSKMVNLRSVFLNLKPAHFNRGVLKVDRF